MDIVFLSNVYPSPLLPTKGTFNREMVRALARRHTVRVVNPIAWTDELRRARGRSLPRARAELANGVEVCYPRFWYPPGMLRSWYGGFLWKSLRRELSGMVQASPPDAVLSYWAHPDGDAAVRLARSSGARAVTMVGGSDVLLLARESAARGRAIGRVLHESDAVVAVSEDLRQAVVAMGIAAEKVRVVYRGVDRGQFAAVSSASDAKAAVGYAPSDTLLVWAGRMVPVKGLEVLLRAFARLRLSPRLALVGGGPLEATLRSEAEALGVADRVQFVGPLSHDALAGWFQAADAVVLPSRSEGIPNVLLEAMACGARFVASRVGGLPEIADDAWDRLVAPGDAVTLAAALEDVLASPRPGSPRRFIPWTWEESAARLSDVLRGDHAPATPTLPRSAAVVE